MLLIGLAFLFVILLGSLLLFFPFTHKSNSFSIEYIDALFTSISATCVTGLVSIKEGVADTFNIFGYVIIAILIQIGGFGAAMVGVSIFIIFARKLSFQQQNLIKESWNISNYKGLKRIFLLIVLTTFVFELIGATLLFLDFYFYIMKLEEEIILHSLDILFLLQLVHLIMLDLIYLVQLLLFRSKMIFG